MKKYVLVTLHDAVPGREPDFDAWYDQYLADVLRCPGFVSGQRLRVVSGHSDAHAFGALYRIDTSDLGRLKAAMRSRIGTIEMPISDAVDRQQARNLYFEVAGEEILGSIADEHA